MIRRVFSLQWSPHLLRRRHRSLQVDSSAVTASLLFELINVQRAAGNGSSVNDVPRSGLTPFSDFHPTASDSWVNGLWFVSLSLSLTYLRCSLF